MLHQNIAGLINKTDELLVCLEQLKAQNIDVDIVCITEHNIKTGNESLLVVPNYQLTACYSRKKSKGGACILVKSGHQWREIDEIKAISVSGIFEVCAIELLNCNAIIICLYRPPINKNIPILVEFLEIGKYCIKFNPEPGLEEGRARSRRMASFSSGGQDLRPALW